jgi:arginine-tRNA-protein transferase
METLCRYIVPPSQCGYLPDQVWQLEYEHVTKLSAAEYQLRMEQGWRRFGKALFRPRCRLCRACEPIRVLTDRFHPNRSQRRVAQANQKTVELRIGPPVVTRGKLALYDRYHAFQSQARRWPAHAAKDATEYASSFVDNPFPTEEWCYCVGSRLVGVGYVDVLPSALSAIYFFYDPQERGRSLGTWHVLSAIASAAARGIPHVYLGYYVAGCHSMAYKSRFKPNQTLGPDGHWHDFLP